MSFANRTVIVTGAAGNLGKAVAQAFGELGTNLVLVDLKREALDKAFGSDSDRQILLAANLLQMTEASALAQAALTRFARIDVLCNITGGFRMGETVHETSDENWNFLFDINARTVLNTVRAVVPHMLAAGGGAIVNVGANSAARGLAPCSRKYNPQRPSLLIWIKELSTPCSRTLPSISRPSGLSGRRLTHADLNPRRETPTATFSSPPPGVTLKPCACSSRRSFWGTKRSMASPKVTTSWGIF